MISAAEFCRIREALGQQATEDIAWSESCQPPTNAEDFANELGYVICNSGMKNTVAVGIWQRILAARERGESAASAFGHVGKAKAIQHIWDQRAMLFDQYTNAADKLAFLADLPWIGQITKYHAAKNFGVDCCKPDVHLMRLAVAHNTTPHNLCADLAGKTGFKIRTVDVILWRACANGIIDSKSIASEARHEQ